MGDTFLKRCPDKLEGTFSMDDNTAFAEWAGALLEQSPALRKVRFRLVPSRMKEDVFWSRYFAAVRRVARAAIFHSEEDDEDDTSGTDMPLPVNDEPGASLQVEQSSDAAAPNGGSGDAADSVPNGSVA